MLLLNARELAAARTDCEHVIALDPALARAHNILALVCIREQRWADAISAFARALELGVDRTMAGHCRQGIAACRQMLQGEREEK